MNLYYKVGISKVGISKVGISKVGISKVGISKVGISKVGISNIVTVLNVPSSHDLQAHKSILKLIHEPINNTIRCLSISNENI